jgi:hypothetical protein
MSNWWTWDKVLEHWGLENFELFNFLKKGLQPYTQHGKKVVDSDKLERGRKYSVEQIEDGIRNYPNTDVWINYDVLSPHDDNSALDDWYVEGLAESYYEGQPLEILNPPKDCFIMSFTLTLDEDDAREKIAKAQSFIFKKNDVLKFEKEHNIGQQDKVFPCKPGTKWEQIKITLIDEEVVRVETPQNSGQFSYHQLEMADERTNDKRPNAIWILLKMFAKNQGIISRQTINYDPTLPDTAKRLNKQLQKLFDIKDSIYVGHYKAEKGYRTKIIFSDQTQVT